MREWLKDNTLHLEEWVGWLAEGYKYAKNSPYTRKHWRNLIKIPFSDLHSTLTDGCIVEVDLKVGNYIINP
jgi:hypothetical protein